MDQGVLIGASAAAGAIVAAIAQAVLNLRIKSHELKQIEIKVEVEELRKIIDSYKLELIAVRNEVAVERRRGDDALTRHSECEKGHALAVARIGHLEEALDAAGIKYRPWGTGPDSAKTQKPH